LARVPLEKLSVAKLKNPEVHLYDVEADPQQIERMKRIVERVWEGIQSGIFYPAPSAMHRPGCPSREQCREWQG
jgi:hypothetical protein